VAITTGYSTQQMVDTELSPFYVILHPCYKNKVSRTI